MKKLLRMTTLFVLSLLMTVKVNAAEVLPQTGEASSWILILVAVIAVIAGIWLVVSSRRKK